MDVLSDVLAVMRTGRPRSVQVTWHGSWAQRFAPVPGAVGFHVILRGPCWILRPDADPLPLTAGDVVFRPHGRGHTLADSPATRPVGPACRPDEPALLPRYAVDTVGIPSETGGPAAVILCGAYELDPALVHPLLHDLPELIHIPAHLGHHPELRAAVDLLTAELTRPRLGTDALIPALLDTLLLYILRSWFDQQPALRATGWAAALGDPAVAAALQAMHRDPARPWTVAGLAAEARLSRAPFARRFTALLGQPPLTYLTWWRMTTAARLLRQTDTPLSTIAGEVGYGSEFAFANAFKRRYGTAPGRYRRQA
ncbi:AraC family transcriptional regulator [Planomonospora sp. ID91781]|uniref:AraC family transcriptional regulator n=1 Tax=Planomonospora sp. ID91781 TaxID=2738135 RepID=UPI0018C4505C|nr:AraC family transcriptional regulator [Planomonospora sp. ID91781]MBG0824734.1 AraC family transcriptional regulator [Planomonospora sp. ID91781]